MSDSKKATRAWVRQQTRQGRLAAMPAILLGLAGIVAAAAQAWCVAAVLGGLAHRGVWLLAFGGLALGRAGLQMLAESASFEAGAAARVRLRRTLFARLLAAGPALLRGRHSAELAATVIDRIESLDGLYARWVPAATLAVAGPAVVAGAALVVDPLAALVLVLAGLAVPFGMALAGIGAGAASRRQFLAMSRLQTRFLDRVRGIATLVLAGRAEDEARALATAAAELSTRTMRVLRVAFLSSAALDCAMAAALVVLALRAGHGLRVHRTAITPALFGLLLVPEFFAPLRAFAAAYQDQFQAAGAAEDLLALPAEAPPAPAPPASVRDVTARGVTVSFEDVRLTWDPARGPALDGLSFFVQPGETLVLAGPSGAGKSTVIELLLGFVAADGGRVLINGHDIAAIVPRALSRFTGWVGQRPMLFAGSIADNIRFARPDASDAEVIQAATQAQVQAFADTLPRSLDTPIGEGGYGLSGGQAQRVAIARAFLKDAPLLLLDEPTAHLDPAAEQDVFTALRRLAVGRTVILASHAAAAHGFAGRRLDIRAGRAVLPARSA